MDLGITKKKALVTGGATGIGRAIALELASEGADVVITSRDSEALEKTLLELRDIRKGHYGIITELVGDGEPQRLADVIKKEFGDLDIVVNNAGSSFSINDPYCPIADWRQIFRLNLEVPVEINNEFIPYMKEQDWGRIVNISAGAGLENSGPVPYGSSKAAITSYTRSMGRILAIETSNVVMTALLPGVVLTENGHWANVLKERPEHAEKYLSERCPSGRFGKPDEISPMAVLLCSDKATFCQGSIILVDAGQAKHYMYNNFLS